MEKVNLIATCAFGLETVVKWEVQALGYENLRLSNGKVEFDAPLEDIPRFNLWLRSADRLLLKMGAFRAVTFDELFEQTKALPWEAWITPQGRFTVLGKSVKSALGSVRACQSIVKKAIVERLKSAYHLEWLPETGPDFTVQVALLKDEATLTIDTSGTGLHRRGYRVQSVAAPLRETMAAALVQLSFWKPERLLLDPMCGSGTILIEAALLGRNIAPGLKRRFASEEWPRIPARAWKEARRDARDAVRRDLSLEIFGYDADAQAVAAARRNAEAAGVAGDITFEQKDIHDLWIDRQYGIVITNPPYGIKMGDFQQMNAIYITLNKMFRKKKGWSLYVITADKKFPDYFKRARPDRVRKLYNGPIQVQYYQYYGEKPPPSGA
ncbi:MAG TPA: class I SAM-dependent RNA methyltransferase [Chloroflexi bacterium]|nr:class I SAM-dependent RNA methyltransferase [Chloroflexota bacterium]